MNQDDDPIISVVVPCYNCEDYIATTLRAVIGQTFDRWECLVIDDASTDGSAEVVEELAAADERIRLIRLEKNLGAAGARNAGIVEAEGRYLAFLDADDWWVPEKLERQLDHAIATGAAIVHSSYRFVDEDGRFLRGGVMASDRVDLRSYMRNTEIGMSTSLIDRVKVGEFSLRDIRLCQDTNLWLELLARGFVSRGMRDILVHYRIREGQISGSKIGMARQVLSLYLGIEQVGLPERLWCFGCYAVNGIRKRLHTPRFSNDRPGAGGVS